MRSRSAPSRRHPPDRSRSNQRSRRTGPRVGGGPAAASVASPLGATLGALLGAPLGRLPAPEAPDAPTSGDSLDAVPGAAEDAVDDDVDVTSCWSPEHAARISAAAIVSATSRALPDRIPGAIQHVYRRCSQSASPDLGCGMPTRHHATAAPCQSTSHPVTCNQMVVYGTLNRITDDEVDRIFRALADATRRDIVRRTLVGEVTVSQLASAYDMSFAAVQKHVAVLEGAGLVTKHPHGRERLVRGNPDDDPAQPRRCSTVTSSCGAPESPDSTRCSPRTSSDPPDHTCRPSSERTRSCPSPRSTRTPTPSP